MNISKSIVQSLLITSIIILLNACGGGGGGGSSNVIGINAVPSGGTYKTTVTVSLSCSNNCASMYFTVDGSDPTTESYIYTSPLVVDVNVDIKYISVDGGGNSSSVQTERYVIDTTAPSTTASPDSGIYGVIDVSLSCSDGSGSGCDKIYYTTDGSSPTTSSSVYVVPIRIEETTTLKYFAMDNVGYAESIKTKSYFFDDVGPESHAIPAGGTYSSTQVQIKCADVGGSGCDKIHYTLDGTLPDSSSPIYDAPIALITSAILSYYSVDNGGISETVNTEVYEIDTDSPVTRAYPNGGIYNSSRSVILICDDGTGVGCSKTYYTLDGSTPNVNSSVFSLELKINSDTVVKYISVDMVGNQEILNTDVYTIDSIPPMTSLSSAGGIYNAEQTITLTCDDGGGSGCISIHYRLDGGSTTVGLTMYSEPLVINENVTLRYFAFDNAGNQEIPKTDVYTIDTISPSIKITKQPSSTINYSDVHFKFFTDDINANIQGDLNGAGYVNISNPYTIRSLSEGDYSLQVRAVDHAGNESSALAAWSIVYGMPIANIVFPPKQSLTEGGAITIRGIANDNTAIQSVYVNNVLAATDDAYSTWIANVSLVSGKNDIVVRVVDIDGNENNPSDNVIIERIDTMLATPVDVDYDPINNQLYVIDDGLNALVKVDAATGERTIISDKLTGAGPYFEDLLSMVLDTGNNRVYVSDFRLRGIFSVDLTTGDRSVLSNNLVGTGKNFGLPRGLSFDNKNQRILVADAFVDDIISVDIETGNRTTISNPDVSLLSLGQPKDLALNTAKDVVYVIGSNLSNNKIIEINTKTGVRSYVEMYGDWETNIQVARNISFDNERNRLIVLRGADNELVEIDLNTNHRTMLVRASDSYPDIIFSSFVLDEIQNRLVGVDSIHGYLIEENLAMLSQRKIYGSSIGGGNLSAASIGMDVDFSSGTIMVTNVGWFSGSVTSVDLYGSDRLEIANSAGEGFPYTFYSLGDISLDLNNNRAFIVNKGPDNLIELNVKTGERKVIIEKHYGIGGIAYDHTNDLLYMGNRIENNVKVVDVKTGIATLINDEASGDGTLFDPYSINLDMINNRLLVGGYLYLHEIDLDTGYRHTVSGTPVGMAGYITSIDLFASGSKAVGAVYDRAPIFLFDLLTGDVTTISDNNTGKGVQLLAPSKIKLNPDNDVAIVLDTQWNALLSVDMRTGDRVILSK